MKVYINRKIRTGPWGGGNMFVKAFYDVNEKDPNVEIMLDKTMSINPDVMLLAGLENEGPEEIGVEQAIMYKMYVKPDCQLILRVNENGARKDTDHMDAALVAVSHHIDGTVFVSNWLRDYFMERGWACKNNTVIVNGVDREIFKPQPKLNNGKLNIVAHHWSDNRMKGADIYEKLDEFVGENPDKFSFTYIGRHQCAFKHTNVVRPLSGKRLGEELGKYDLYVSASRFDPGPNHILEALACGLPTYVHKDGGGCVEFAGPNATFDNFNQLALFLNTHADLRSCSPSAVNTFTLSTWQDCVQEYNRFLEATWKASKSDSQTS